MVGELVSVKRQGDSRAELRRASRRGHHGTRIRVHRSLDSLRFRRPGLLTLLLLPFVMTAAFAYSYDALLSGWESVLRFGIERLSVAGSVERVTVPMLVFPLQVLTIHVNSGYPDPFIWWATAAMVGVVMLASFYLPEWALPLAYVLRVGCVVQAISLLVFYFWPTSFPYDAPRHLRDCFALGVAMIGLVPWVHALTYYVFDFGILRKIALSAFTMVFLTCYLPVKILVHAYILDHFSLLFMPILFLALGVAIDVFMLIALYAWGMSWDVAHD